MTRILLAGATGALGRGVYRELLSRGYAVRRLVRNKPTEADWLGDLRDSTSLKGCCDGIDAVISCAGASMNLHTWQDHAGFREVDWLGNLTLLQEARSARVGKFVYVSLAGGPGFIETSYARYHEQFAAELSRSGLDWSVVRPTGLFSFFMEILKMAQRGHGVVIGNGNCRTNPIHDSDAARACVDSLRPGPLEMPAGGPVVYTRREIVELAFGALNRNPIIHSVPTWALAPLPFLMRAANRRIAGLVEFGTVVSTVDCTAAHYGDRNLEDYFREAASALASSGRQPEGKEAQRRGNTVSA